MRELRPFVTSEGISCTAHNDHLIGVFRRRRRDATNVAMRNRERTNYCRNWWRRPHSVKKPQTMNVQTPIQHLPRYKSFQYPGTKPPRAVDLNDCRRLRKFETPEGGGVHVGPFSHGHESGVLRGERRTQQSSLPLLSVPRPLPTVPSPQVRPSKLSYPTFLALLSR